jgi:hypothetical protein
MSNPALASRSSTSPDSRVQFVRIVDQNDITRARRQGAAFTGMIVIVAMIGCWCAGPEITAAAGLMLATCEVGRRCVR